MDQATAYKAAWEEILWRTEGERDLIANLSNTSAILNQYMEEINWVGFYLLKEDQLVLGPFQGRPACVRIQIGHGVCGTAFALDQIQLVEDVRRFPGHIACDARSRSEIVIPMHQEGRAVAVLDIDSPILARFNETDREALEAIVRHLEHCCQW